MTTKEQIERENREGYRMEETLRNYFYVPKEYVECENCGMYIEVDENEKVYQVDLYGDGKMYNVCEHCYNEWLEENKAIQDFDESSDHLIELLDNYITNNKAS